MSSSTSKSRFRIGDQEFMVFARTKKFLIPAALSKAEAAVYSLVVNQKENAEIAMSRETSEGTVANQLRSIYKKLGVKGRGELIANVEWSKHIQPTNSA